MKYIYIALAIIILIISHVIVYELGVSKKQTNGIIVTENKPITTEVIKNVDRQNSTQVNAALDAKINIDRKYSGITNGFIYANIRASDGFKSASVRDKIKIDSKQNLNTVIIGYGVYLASKEICKASNIQYLRAFNDLQIGCNLIFNVWDSNKIYGAQVLIGYTF